MRTSSTWIEKLQNTHMLVSIGFRLTHVICFFFFFDELTHVIFFFFDELTRNLIQQWQWVHIPSLDHFSKIRHSVQRAEPLVSQVKVYDLYKNQIQRTFSLWGIRSKNRVLMESSLSDCLCLSLSPWKACMHWQEDKLIKKTNQATFHNINYRIICWLTLR